MSELGKYYQNKQLPAEVQERIKSDALARYPARMASPRFMVEVDMNEDRRLSYIAGATVMAQNVQQAIALMQEVINISDRKHDAWDRAKEFIKQWKEGKESEPVKEKWIQAQSTWNSYPVGTKAKAVMGGYWIKTERGWNWPGGGTFPTPGGDATGEICLPD